MLITKETQERINNMPLPFRIACNTLLDILENILGYKYECSVEEMTQIAADYEARAKGKYGKEDLVNYDEACVMLGYTVNNRAGLKALLDKHGIKQVHINGQRVGFPRHQVEALIPKSKKK